MAKTKIIFGIVMTVVTLICIIAYSLAWYTSANSDVKASAPGMIAKDPSILTVGDEIYNIQDMGNYKGQTGFAFYRFIEEENDPAFADKYILDKDGNKITKTFPVYKVNAVQLERFSFDHIAGQQTNMAIYRIKYNRLLSNSDEYSPDEPFRLRVTNSQVDVSGDPDYLTSGADYNSFEVLSAGSDTVIYDENLAKIDIEDAALGKRVKVTVGSRMLVFDFEHKDDGSFQKDSDTSYYDNTDWSRTTYNRIAGTYSVVNPEGIELYSETKGDTVTFDLVTNKTSVVRTLRSLSNEECKRIYTDADGNLNLESKRYRVVRIVTDVETYYQIYDKSSNPQCLYDGSDSENVTIDVVESDEKVTAYAVDDGRNMEDSAYSVAIQFELVLNTQVGSEYYLQFAPQTIGIVPVHEAAKQILAAIEGSSRSDVFYTYVDADKVMFGLDIVTEYISNVMKTTTVTNYEGNMITVTDKQMFPITGTDSYGNVRYETTKGYSIYYSPDGGANFEPLTVAQNDNIDTIDKYVEIRGEKKAYSADAHGDLRYALNTSTNYNLYYRDREYSRNDVMDADGNVIDAYADAEVFCQGDVCWVYRPITEANRDFIQVGLNENALYTAIDHSVVKDKDGHEVYSSGKGNTVVSTKREMYFLPLSSFYKDFNLEVGIVDHSDIAQSEWDAMSALDKHNLLKTYKVDAEGNLLDYDGLDDDGNALLDNAITFPGTEKSIKLYCVSRIYYSDPYTFYNLNSPDELTYNYNYDLATPMYTVESTGHLKPFAYSDYAFMGSHFLIRLSVAGGEK